MRSFIGESRRKTWVTTLVKRIFILFTRPKKEWKRHTKVPSLLMTRPSYFLRDERLSAVLVFPNTPKNKRQKGADNNGPSMLSKLAQVPNTASTPYWPLKLSLELHKSIRFSTLNYCVCFHPLRMGWTTGKQMEICLWNIPQTNKKLWMNEFRYQ